MFLLNPFFRGHFWSLGFGFVLWIHISNKKVIIYHSKCLFNTQKYVHEIDCKHLNLFCWIWLFALLLVQKWSEDSLVRLEEVEARRFDRQHLLLWDYWIKWKTWCQLDSPNTSSSKTLKGTHLPVCWLIKKLMWQPGT